MSHEDSSSLYDYVFTELGDPRTKDWFLIASPTPLVIIIVVYLLYVTAWGPSHMKSRKPVELNSTLIVYNFLQVLISVYLVYEVVVSVSQRKDFTWSCHPLIEEVTETAMREARCVYLYFLAKISELLDTVFFVIRKKNNQVTFLHTYHHAVMPIITWVFVKYTPGGHVLFAICLNSFIHIIMYLYYMLAACGPQLQKYLWWKKYITMLQMVQFLMICYHDIQLLFIDCYYPRFSLLFTTSNTLIFLILFNNFYTHAYKKGKTGSPSNKNSIEGEKLHEK